MVQYFREFRDRSHDHENFIHEIFAYTYMRIPAARNHEIYFHENLLLSRFREIHENFEPRKFGAIRYPAHALILHLRATCTYAADNLYLHV